MRHWDTEKSWSLSFRERVAARRETEAVRERYFGFHHERREHLSNEAKGG